MTDTIIAIRVWRGDTKTGRERFDLIGHLGYRTFRGSTLNAWIASVWQEAAKRRESLVVTWEVSGDGRYKNVTMVDAVPTETHV